MFTPPMETLTRARGAYGPSQQTKLALQAGRTILPIENSKFQVAVSINLELSCSLISVVADIDAPLMPVTEVFGGNTCVQSLRFISLESLIGRLQSTSPGK